MHNVGSLAVLTYKKAFHKIFRTSSALVSFGLAHENCVRALLVPILASFGAKNRPVKIKHMFSRDGFPRDNTKHNVSLHGSREMTFNSL